MAERKTTEDASIDAGAFHVRRQALVDSPASPFSFQPIGPEPWPSRSLRFVGQRELGLVGRAPRLWLPDDFGQEMTLKLEPIEQLIEGNYLWLNAIVEGKQRESDELAWHELPIASGVEIGSDWSTKGAEFKIDKRNLTRNDIRVGIIAIFYAVTNSPDKPPFEIGFQWHMRNCRSAFYSHVDLEGADLPYARLDRNQLNRDDRGNYVLYITSSWKAEEEASKQASLSINFVAKDWTYVSGYTVENQERAEITVPAQYVDEAYAIHVYYGSVAGSTQLAFNSLDLVLNLYTSAFVLSNRLAVD